ncbi:MAG: hypothetical protein JXR40_03545 [Pontiellaceae bacterium]|nr:hypothetical protein [Pontiellaceae bacterium]
METKIESFGAPRFYKYFMAFGVLLFATGFVGSIAFIFISPFNQHSVTVWILSFSAVTHAVFTALCVSVLRTMDDTVEISEHGIAARRRHKPDTEITWEEIEAVDDFLKARCLKLRSADGRIIRIEFQFNNFPALLDLLERNLTHIGNSSVRHIFGKHVSFYIGHLFIFLFAGGLAAGVSTLGIFWVMILPIAFALPSIKVLLLDPIKVAVNADGIHLIALLRRREIKYTDINDTRLELAPRILTLSIKERQSDKEIRLTGFKRIFHLSQLIRHHHERLFDECAGISSKS